MGLYPFPANRKTYGILGLYLAALLLLCRDTLVTSCLVGFVPAQLGTLGLLALGALAFLICQRKNWKAIFRDRRMVFLLVLTAALLLPMAAKQDWQLMYFSVLLCLYAGVLLSYVLTVEQAAKYYVGILSLLGAYSLLATYVLRLLPDLGIWNVPTFHNSMDVEFYNFGLCYVSVSYSKNRNFGIFREPGVYQYFLMLALVANNYLVTWPKTWQQWAINGLLAGVMLSTLATGGYVELAIFAGILFVDKKLYRSKAACILAVSALAAAAGLVLWAYWQKNMLWWEIYAMTVSKFGEGETSGADRINSIAINLEYFLHNPLFGASVREVLHAIEHNTSSSTIMLAIFGLLGGILHGASWVALLWRRHHAWVSLGLLLVMGMAFNTQNLIADLFFWLLPTMALIQKAGSWKGRKNRGGSPPSLS